MICAQAAGAAKAYVEAARLEPGAADARLNLAGALQRARAPASAVEAECRKAFELDASLARRRATRLSRFRPPPWDRPWARAVERLWDSLKAANYGRDEVRRRVNAAAGGTVLHRSYPSGRDWHELRLSLTAAALDDLETDALGTLVACFLIGVAVAEAALAKALGPDSTAQLRRAGVLVDVDVKDGRRCCGALQLFPILDDDVIATDWSSETLLDANDAVMSVGTESLELALLAPPPRRGARVLDLCCGSGVQGVVALCRGAASVTFVDTSRRALAFCRVNVLGCERRGRLGDARFLRCDARHARDVALRAGGRAFDVVLANPPFVAGGSARFEVASCADLFDSPVYALAEEIGGFPVALDSALLHCLDDKMQRRYVAELARVVRTGGRLYVGCFSDANPDPWSNPRRLSEAHLRALFAGPAWRVESVEPAWYERPRAMNEGHRSGAWTMAWWCRICRLGAM